MSQSITKALVAELLQG